MSERRLLQVRENVGRLLAMLFANLAQSPPSGSSAGAKWPALQARAAALRQSLVERAPAAVAKVQEISGGSEGGEHDEAVRWMETVRSRGFSPCLLGLFGVKEWRLALGLLIALLAFHDLCPSRLVVMQ